MQALKHRKGWKYQRARYLFGSGKWDGAAWDKDAVNAELAELAVHLAEQAVARRAEEEALQERLRVFAARQAAQAALADASAVEAVETVVYPGLADAVEGSAESPAEASVPESDCPEIDRFLKTALLRDEGDGVISRSEG